MRLIAAGKSNDLPLKAVFYLLLLICTDFSFGQITWEWKHPLPSNNDLWGIAFGANTFVAVADGGVVFTSHNGTEWTRRSTGTYFTLYAICYGGGRFVAVGDSGIVLTSPDGIAWKQHRNKEMCDPLVSVACGNGHCIATSRFSSLFTSSDAISWEHLRGNRDYRDGPPQVLFRDSLFEIIYFDGKYVSSDAENWEYRHLSSPNFSRPPHLSSVAYGMGVYIMVGRFNFISVSADSLSWKRILPKFTSESLEYFSNITFGAGLFAVIGNGAIYTSPDAGHWKKVAQCRANHFYSIVYGGGRFVAIGDSGVMLISDSGKTWKRAAMGANEKFTTILYKKNRFIVRGDDGTFFVLQDDNLWKRFESDKKSVNRQDILPVVAGKNRYVASTDWGEVLSSPDGLIWTERNTCTEENITGMQFIDGRYFALTPGAMIASHDGDTWITVKIGSTSAFIYEAGWFIGVGGEGTISTSRDGISWTRRISGTSRYLHSIAYGSKQFTVIGTDGCILGSPVDTGFIRKKADCLDDSIIGVQIINKYPDSDDLIIYSLNATGGIATSKAKMFRSVTGQGLEGGYIYPAIPSNGKTINDFIPYGWTLLKSASGDLNKDTVEDLALVLQQRDTVDSGGLSISYHRILAIAFKNKIANRYDLMEQSNSFIIDCIEIPASEEEASSYIDSSAEERRPSGGEVRPAFDPFLNIGIEKGSVRISFRKNTELSRFVPEQEYDESNSYDAVFLYIFRFQNDEFTLIGVDTRISQLESGWYYNSSLNLSTKQKFESTKRLIKGRTKEGVVKSMLSIEKLPTLRTFNRPFTMDLDSHTRF